MYNSNNRDTSRDDLILPGLSSVYAALSPLSVLYMRVIAGVALMAHGLPKIQNPLGAVSMVESIGFAPGWLFSPLLAGGEFIGGLLLAIGLLTRPAAAIASFILLVTVYFHWIMKSEGYAGAELSLIWMGVTIFFAVHGAGRFSVDRAIGKQF